MHPSSLTTLDQRARAAVRRGVCVPRRGYARCVGVSDSVVVHDREDVSETGAAPRLDVSTRDDDRLPARSPFGVLLLVGVLVASAFVHLYNLRAGDGAVDEDAYTRAGWAYVHGHFSSHLEAPPLAQLLFGYAQEVFGHNVTSARLVSAFAGLVTLVVLAVWAHRLGGLVAAIAAAALWGLLRHAAVMGGWSTVGPRVERLALLDPVATCLVALALWAGWEARRARSSPWAALAGLATGWAATAKAPGILIAPVVLVAITWVREVRRALTAAWLRAAAFITAGVAAVATVYVRFGWHDTVHQIRYMLHFQRAEGARGHPIIIGDVVYGRAPWWAGLRFMTDGLGRPGTFLLLGLAAVGVCSRPKGAAAYGVAAATVTYLGIAATGLMLPHYYVIWLPGLVLAGALGTRALVDAALRSPARPVLVPAAVVVLLALVSTAVIAVATEGEGDYERAAQQISDANIRTVFVVGSTNLLQHALSPRVHVIAGAPTSTTGAFAFVTDELTIKRFSRRSAPATSWVTAAAPRYQREQFGPLTVWMPSAHAAAQSGTDLQG
jgi:4-amino-4-deoxy-L-arabinose transferase-like glycosyltransferase